MLVLTDDSTHTAGDGKVSHVRPSSIMLSFFS